MVFWSTDNFVLGTLSNNTFILQPFYTKSDVLGIFCDLGNTLNRVLIIASRNRYTARTWYLHIDRCCSEILSTDHQRSSGTDEVPKSVGRWQQ
jgi:hypothetical protein